MAKRQSQQREKLKNNFFGVKQDLGAQYAEQLRHVLSDKDLAESNINQSTLEKIYMQGRKSTLSRAKKPVVVYSGVNEPLM